MEDDDDDLDMPFVGGDDSYQGPPAEGFEDSRGAGVSMFRNNASLGSGPTDFGFLLQAGGYPSGTGASGMEEDTTLQSPVVPVPPSAKRGRSDLPRMDVGSSFGTESRPPCPPARPQEVQFGVVPGEDRGPKAMNPPATRIDPFYWFRNDDHNDENVQKLLREEDAYADRALESSKGIKERLYAEMMGHTKEADIDVPAPCSTGYAEYGRTFAGKAYKAHYRAKIIDGIGSSVFKAYSTGTPVPVEASVSSKLVGMELCDEELLLDENELAIDEDGEQRAYLSVKGPEVCGDGELLSYAMDFDGSDCYSIHFRSTPSAKLSGTRPCTDEVLQRTDGSMQWDASGHVGLYYLEQDPDFRACRLRRHLIGERQEQDVLLLHENDKRFSVSLRKTHDYNFLQVNIASSETTEVHLLDLHAPAHGLKCVAPRQFGHRYEVDHCLGHLYLLTNKDGYKDNKLCRTSAAALPSRPSEWEEVWAPGSQTSVSSLRCFEKFIALEGRQGGVRCIFLKSIEQESVTRTVVFPESQVHDGMLLTPRSRTAAISLYSCGFHVMHLFNSDTMRLWYSSYVVPSRIYSYHVPTGAFKLLKEEPAPGFNSTLYRCERITSSHRQVPISLVYRADLHNEGLRGGPYPTLLTGYGAYGACQDPDFDQTLLPLLDRGVLYAVAHVRGGGELGNDWYLEGKYFKVKNRFRDFIAAAETLISLGVSEKSRLAAWGESSGGLLVTGSVNQRPDLFKAMLLEVPFVDAMTTMADPSIPLTAGEWEEVGNPNEEEYFYYTLEYSPYDNIRMQNYPAALCTSSLNDAMVGYWEPLKYVSKLRQLKTDSNLVLLKVNFHAGHGHSSDRYEALMERARNFAFLLEQLGLS